MAQLIGNLMNDESQVSSNLQDVGVQVTATLSESDIQIDGTLSESGIQINGSLSSLGLRGYSAYELAVKHGFVGTEQEWLDSLRSRIETKYENGTVYYKFINEDTWHVLLVEPDPNIPEYVKNILESDIENWNAKGTYSKPNGGIPQSDLSIDVQASLNKADSALQEHQDISGKADKSDIPTKISELENDEGYLTEHQSLTEYAKKSEIESLIPDDIATNEYVNQKVAGLVNSAPETLDTLKELSQALDDDPNFATTMTTELGKKVDKIEGKGLSTEDYTTIEKTKLAGIATGAEVNVQSDWNQSSTTSDDYIKNRPFYSETTDTLIISDTIYYDANDDSTSLGNYTRFLLDLDSLYIVTINNISCECRLYNTDNGYLLCDIEPTNGLSTTEYKVLGRYMIPDNSSNGWLYEAIFDRSYFNYPLFNSSNSSSYLNQYAINCNVSIYKREEIVHKLDNKYLNISIDKCIQITNLTTEPTLESLMQLEDGYYQYDEYLENPLTSIWDENNYVDYLGIFKISTYEDQSIVDCNLFTTEQKFFTIRSGVTESPSGYSIEFYDAIASEESVYNIATDVIFEQFYDETDPAPDKILSLDENQNFKWIDKANVQNVVILTGTVESVYDSETSEYNEQFIPDFTVEEMVGHIKNGKYIVIDSGDFGIYTECYVTSDWDENIFPVIKFNSFMSGYFNSVNTITYTKSYNEWACSSYVIPNDKETAKYPVADFAPDYGQDGYVLASNGDGYGGTKWVNIDNKVDKVNGKGLSANDYDNTAKSKVDAIPDNPKYTDTIVNIDTTLANSGQAADAKATGDAIAKKRDISSSYDKTTVDSKLAGKQDTLTAGENITIDGNVISATGGGGAPGADGKSAYQYAVEGGYPGTETEFAEKLAAEIPPDLTEEVRLINDDLSKVSESITDIREHTDTFFGYNKEEIYTDYDWELGTINSTTGAIKDDSTRLRTNDYIPIEKLLSIEFSTKKVNFFFYSADKTYISSSGWEASPNVKTKDDMPTNAKYVKMAYLAANGASEDVTVKIGVSSGGEWGEFLANYEQIKRTAERNGRAVVEKFNIVAYSKLNDTIINTKEHFIYCAKNGFDALKCDVRITADNKIVLCHDDGFTLDANGRITSYSISNHTAIRNMTYAEIMALEHSSQYGGIYVHPTDLETFLIICKRFGKIPYITIRDEYIDIVAPIIVSLVKKYGFVENAIINSFTYDSLMTVRMLEPTIRLSEVFAPQNSTLFNNALSHARANKNYDLCLFYSSYSGVEYGVDWFNGNTEVLEKLETMRNEGIKYYGAQSTLESDIDALIKLGFSGTQHKRKISTI